MGLQHRELATALRDGQKKRQTGQRFLSLQLGLREKHQQSFNEMML
jgi:hypothetical protein